MNHLDRIINTVTELQNKLKELKLSKIDVTRYDVWISQLQTKIEDPDLKEFLLNQAAYSAPKSEDDRAYAEYLENRVERG